MILTRAGPQKGGGPGGETLLGRLGEGERRGLPAGPPARLLHSRRPSLRSPAPHSRAPPPLSPPLSPPADPAAHAAPARACYGVKWHHGHLPGSAPLILLELPESTHLMPLARLDLLSLPLPRKTPRHRPVAPDGGPRR